MGKRGDMETSPRTKRWCKRPG